MKCREIFKEFSLPRISFRLSLNASAILAKSSAILAMPLCSLLCLTAYFLGGCKRNVDGAAAQYADSPLHIDNLSTPPNEIDRDFTCPTQAKSLTATRGGKSVSFEIDQAKAMSQATWHSLKSVLSEFAPPERLRATLIEIRRQGGQPYLHYSSNGTWSDAFEPWSSSKYLAFAAVAARLREASKGKVGLTGMLEDPNFKGQTPIGDLVTEATTYRHSCFDKARCPNALHYAHFTSNNAATWAKNMAGRKFTNEIVTQWIGQPQERFDGAYQSYTKNYTASANGWGWKVTEKDGSTVTLKEGQIGEDAQNYLSTFAMAEGLKRLVLHREASTTRLPGITWNDLAVLFYGPPQQDSRYFKDLAVGGMSAGAATYFENAFGGSGSKTLEKMTMGQWRLFSKVGWGPNKKGGGSDFIWNAYACVPKFDAGGKALPSGKEFIVSIALKGLANKTDAEQDRLFSMIVKKLVSRIMDGNL